MLRRDGFVDNVEKEGMIVEYVEKGGIIVEYD